MRKVGIKENRRNHFKQYEFRGNTENTQYEYSLEQR